MLSISILPLSGSLERHTKFIRVLFLRHLARTIATPFGRNLQIEIIECPALAFRISGENICLKLISSDKPSGGFCLSFDGSTTRGSSARLERFPETGCWHRVGPHSPGASASIFVLIKRA